MNTIPRQDTHHTTARIAEFLTAYLSADFSPDEDLPDFLPETSDYPDFSGPKGKKNPSISPDPLLEMMRRNIAETEQEIARSEAELAGPQPRRPSRSEAPVMLALCALATALPAELDRLYWPGAITLVQTPPGYEAAVEQALSKPVRRQLRALAAVGTDHAEPKVQVFKSGATTPRDRMTDQRSFRAKLAALLQQGASILVLTADRDVIDGDLAEVTVLNMALTKPSPETLLTVLHHTHPETFDADALRSLLPKPETLGRLSAQGIGTAFRAEHAKDVVLRLAEMGNRIDGDAATTLDDIHGQTEAVARLRRMAGDLDMWRAGKLAWSQVTASALFYGPPGTGKTLAAAALAGTAGIPLITTSYAECQRHGHQGDMLAALHNKVTEAIRLAPSVLFVDEIDSFSRRGGNDHNDRYLRGVVNGLLTELTRLAETPGVIVLAATNHPDDVDPAVIRSGRLDAKIAMKLPDLRGISTQLEDGLTKLQPPAAISERKRSMLSRRLLGSSGADIAALLRAAASAARETGGPVMIEQLHAAADNLVPRLDPGLDHRMAVHEAGHVLAGYLLRRPMPISVRLTSQGGAVISPKRQFHTIDTASAELTFLLSGRMAEILVFGDVSSGAGEGPQSDLAQATRLAMQLERQWHLSDDGLAWFDIDASALLLADPRLQGRMESRLRAAETEAMQLLSQNFKYIHRLARVLLRERELDANWIRRILAGIDHEERPEVGAEIIPFPLLPKDD
ncbi:AAA family ATPase [Rhodobacter capsulatus]|uniref:AAA family ATPase n=1 Tax=Rhodobacter capsulatus TaxID=1061 RepID=UPI004029A912